jgi:hypothetical protein
MTAGHASQQRAQGRSVTSPVTSTVRRPMCPALTTATRNGTGNWSLITAVCKTLTLDPDLSPSCRLRDPVEGSRGAEPHLHPSAPSPELLAVYKPQRGGRCGSLTNAGRPGWPLADRFALRQLCPDRVPCCAGLDPFSSSSISTRSATTSRSPSKTRRFCVPPPSSICWSTTPTAKAATFCSRPTNISG